MELLRVVAMTGVLLLHANYFCFGYPQYASCTNATAPVYLARFFLEYGCIAAVDVFVMLSGWFGIHARVRGALRILAEALFVGLIVSAFLLVRGQHLGTFYEWLQAIFSTWFIWAYLALYVFSPALNRFVEHATEPELRYTLLAVFAIEWVDYALQLGAFSKGFSGLHFMAVYLLARYLRLYGASRLERVSSSLLVAAYFGLTLLMVGVQWSLLWAHNAKVYNIFLDLLTQYTNPLCVAQAAVLLFIFARLQFQSRVVNLLGGGAFAVYLLHQCKYIRNDYCEIFRNIHLSHTLPEALLFDALAVVAVYLTAVAIDYVFRRFW